MLAADNEKSALNKKAGTDAGALASSHLLDRDITDEEGASPKDNPLAVDDTLAEAITTGVVDNDAPKEKPAAGADEASSFFSLSPLSRDGDTVNGGGGGRTEEKSSDPPWTWEMPTTRRQNRNRLLPFYSFCRWYFRGRARTAVGRQK